MNRLLILAVATWSGVVAAAGTLTIRARVVDGDTLELADGNLIVIHAMRMRRRYRDDYRREIECQEH